MAPTLTRRQTLIAGLAATAMPAIGFAQAREVAEMTMGAADAPVTLVEYAMFTCPHCATFNTEVFPQIKADYIDTGKVRLVFREVYFNKPSLWAAMVARCAPADRYFGIVDVLFATQAKWLSASDEAALVQGLYSIGRQAGLTDAELDACFADRAFAEALVAEYQKNQQADGIEATPTFFVNGKKVAFTTWDDLRASLDAALGA